MLNWKEQYLFKCSTHSLLVAQATERRTAQPGPGQELAMRHRARSVFRKDLGAEAEYSHTGRPATCREIPSRFKLFRQPGCRAVL